MTEKKKNVGGGNQILAEYSWQVFFVFIFASSLFGIFYWLFGLDQDLLWTNSVVLAIWLILLLLSLLIPPIGEFWRVNKWIMGSSVLILLFLFDSSWAQSVLSTSGLERDIVESIPVDTRLYLQAEYPSQIFFDESGKVEIRLLATGSFENLKQRKIIISSTGKMLLFAVKPSSDVPIAWSDSLEFDLSESADSITLLAQPAERARLKTLLTKLNWKADGLDLVTTKGNELRIESKHDSQIRTWKKIFLGTSSLIVALIGTIFAGIKQWDEEEKRKKTAKEDEEKRRKIEEIKSVIDTFDIDIKTNISSALDKYLELLRGWSEWGKPLQNQFINRVTSFLESNELWDSFSDIDITKLTIIVGQFLKLFETFQTVPKPEQLNLLSNSLQYDAFALLTLLKDYPQSIYVAKRIGGNFSSELKKKIPVEYKDDFATQIFDIKDELGFSDSESFPLRNHFYHFAKHHLSEDRLTIWLRAHQLNCSPFADADSPFYSISDNKLLIDLATSGFSFSVSDLRNHAFWFANSWDVGTALFDYCKALQPNIKIKDETFFVTLTPSMIENYGMDLPQKIILHALAEQWIWSLADAPTLFYSLKDIQRALLGRLLRWHDLSPAIIAGKVAEMLQSKREEKSTKTFPLKIKEWLGNIDATDLRVEEINALIRLRPTPKKFTLFLVSTVDPNPHVKKHILPKLHEKLDSKQQWLSAHNCSLVHFLVDEKNRKIVPLFNLENQCKIRMQKCSDDKVDAFDLLFSPHDKKPADFILANKANGSPGKMVRLGQRLLLQHMAKPSPEEYLQIKDLLAIK